MSINQSQYLEPTTINSIANGNKYTYNLITNNTETKMEIIQAWVDDDVEVVPYPNHDIRNISLGNINNNLFDVAELNKNHMPQVPFCTYVNNINAKLGKKDDRVQRSVKSHHKLKTDKKMKTSKTKLNILSKKKNNCLLLKMYEEKTSSENIQIDVKNKSSCPKPEIKPVGTHIFLFIFITCGI